MAYIFVNVNRSVGTINPNIYGQFSEHLGRCIYQGIYVGQASDIPNTNGMRNDVVSALKALHVPVLRWPGGCFADTYHWRDGIGPKENRKTIVNTNWGGVTEDNSFGTHEFMELCRQIGCEAYFSGNVGSGTVQEFSDWVEYCNMGGISPMASERRANGQDEPFNVMKPGAAAAVCVPSIMPICAANIPPTCATTRRSTKSSRSHPAPTWRITTGPKP